MSQVKKDLIDNADDVAKFAIDGTTGVITSTADAFDFESPADTNADNETIRLSNNSCNCHDAEPAHSRSHA